MSPIWTTAHALLAGIALGVLGYVGDSKTNSVAAAVLLGCLAYHLLLVTIYRLLLVGNLRTPMRRFADRVTGLGVPAFLLLALIVVFTTEFDSKTAFGLRRAQWGSVEAAALLALAISMATILCSSLTDRYLVVPWRDGVIGPPAFKRTVVSRDFFTHLQLIHRIVATSVAFVGVLAASGLIWFALAKQFANSDWGLYMLGLASPSVIPAIVMKRWLKDIAMWFGFGFGHLDILIGDSVLLGPDLGVVVEVSIERGVVVAGGPSGSWTLPLAQAHRSPELAIRKTPPNHWDVDAMLATAAIQTTTDYQTQERVPAGWWPLLI